MNDKKKKEQDSVITLRKCIAYAYRRSEMWDTASTILIIVAFILGLIGAGTKWNINLLSSSLIGLTFLWLITNWRQTHHRQKGETLKRHYEYSDGLGLPVSNSIIANYQADFGKKAIKKMETEELEGTSFSSKLDTGPKRLLDHIRESAWYSEKLARTASWITVGLVIVTFFIAFIVLITVFTEVQSQNHLSNLSFLASTIGKIVLFLLSCGIIRRCWGYFSFTSAAHNTFGTCDERKKKTTVTEAEALPITAEYQVLRAIAPQIPSVIWNRKHDVLNDLWDKLNSDHPSSEGD